MSEEIAAASADLATVECLRARVAALESEVEAERAARRRCERVVRAWAETHPFTEVNNECPECAALFRLAHGTYQEKEQSAGDATLSPQSSSLSPHEE